MATYRVICLANSIMPEKAFFDAADDQEAVALFGLRGEKNDCEIWCGNRLVARAPKGAIPRLVI